MAQPGPTLTQRIYLWCWRRPWFRKQFYNALNLILRRRSAVTLLNCGYRDPAAPYAEGDPQAASIELYRRLLVGLPSVGREILELGCGRGGGTAFLHNEAHSNRTVGVDFAGASIRWCRRNHRATGLEFRVGDAGDPPVPPGSFDTVVAVEVTHCLPDKGRFLANAARALRPNGCLAVADFFYTRKDSSHSLASFEAAIEASGLELLTADDWTKPVVHAIEHDSERRAQVIRESVPRLLRSVALGFASTTDSSTYRSLRDGRAVYRRFTLRRSGAN
jgi:SAM-dependent methyltransferase